MLKVMSSSFCPEELITRNRYLLSSWQSFSEFFGASQQEDNYYLLYYLASAMSSLKLISTKPKSVISRERGKE